MSKRFTARSISVFAVLFALLVTLILLPASAADTPPAKPSDSQGGSTPGSSGGGGGSSAPTSWSAAKEYSTDQTVNGGTFSSTGSNENAIHVDKGAKVTFNNITLNRTSSNSTGGDNSSFYGVGAGMLVTEGTAYVNGGTFTTNASGGAGLFAYNKGVIYAANSTIKTTQSSSGGIHAAGGGTVYAWDLNVVTNGGSAAAIRSDRGGGTMRIDGGSYVSNGSGSPAIYCTADIAANNATLTANGSEAICVEGLNSTRLYNCNLTGNMPENSQNDCTWTVIVYQSMSGDSEVGNSTFNMVGGTLTSKNGGLFYTTNTQCHILLSDVKITKTDSDGFFLRCTGNKNARGWGTVEKNGSQCTFTANKQAMDGNIVYDSVSTLDFYMTNASTLKGAVIDDESCAGSGGNGHCNLYIGSDSVWTVTGNSTVTNLYSTGKIVDASGNTVTIKGTDGTVYVKGTSSYTVTVKTYSATDKTSGADAVTSYSKYAVAKPSALSSASTITSTASTTVAAATTVVSAASAVSNSSTKVLAIVIISIVLVCAITAIAILILKRKKSRDGISHTDSGQHP